MTDVIIVVNSGSSSIKFALYPAGEQRDHPILQGKVTDIGLRPAFTAKMEGEPIEPGSALAEIPKSADHAWLLPRLIEWLEGFGIYKPVAAGHRIVHGGSQFGRPVIMDEEVRKTLVSLTPLAPLHQPHNLAAVDAISVSLPDLPQVACFDTGFHQTMPEMAKLFGLPRKYAEEGIQRYGFHGISYDYIASVMEKTLGEDARGRVIVAHLGNGSSMCGMHAGKSVATTMGFTALDGLIMGRRCGSMDAGVVLYLLEQKGMTPHEINHLLYRESGLLGVSGISSSMQVLEQSEAEEAKEAVDLYCYRAAREAGSLIAALGGIDAIVFTAGIGENSPGVRQRICERLSYLGIALDETANTAGHGGAGAIISTKASSTHVAVIPTNEQVVVADATRKLVCNG